jgi:hypothetical protein
MHEYGLDARGDFYEREIPIAGTFKLVVVLGYLIKPLKPRTDDPWSEFTNAQQLQSVSAGAIEISG